MSGEIASLAHEIRNYTVESRPGVTKSLLIGAESIEVRGRLGHDIGSQPHYYTAGIFAVNGHIEVHLWLPPACQQSICNEIQHIR